MLFENDMLNSSLKLVECPYSCQIEYAYLIKIMIYVRLHFKSYFIYFLFSNSQSCHHLVGSAYYLHHRVSLGLKEFPEKNSPTDLPMQWNKPRGLQIKPEKFFKIPLM